MSPLFSVVICTRNRPASLERTLHSLAASARCLEGGRYEVLIVDNGDALDAEGLATRFAAHLPLRVVREPQPGLSVARNTGATEALGEWILWTDDDVSVDPAWLAAYDEAFAQYPEASVMGGPIVPRFEGTPPAWLVAGLAHVRTAFAARDADDIEAVFRADDAIPWGANFATRRAAVRRFPFDADLGRHPERPTGGGEESAVIREILAAGGTGRWLPHAPVLHHIDPARQTPAYLRAYYAELGYRHALASASASGRPHALGRSAMALYRAFGNELRCALARAGSGRDDLALHLKHAARQRGAARAWLRLALGRAPSS